MKALKSQMSSSSIPNLIWRARGGGKNIYMKHVLFYVVIYKSMIVQVNLCCLLGHMCIMLRTYVNILCNWLIL